MRRAFDPLNVTAYVTWAAIAATAVNWSRLAKGEPRQLGGALALLAMLALFAWPPLCKQRLSPAWARANTLLQGVLILLAGQLLSAGNCAVLLIIVAAQLVWVMGTAWVVTCLAVFNAMLLLEWWRMAGDLPARVVDLIPLLGFQGFAAVTGYYVNVSEQRRDSLALANAELLATQQLLVESARSGERLKLSRELHDVAGHKLTALKLILMRQIRNPAVSDREELAAASGLADELLSDIRGVVSALRQHDGLELEAALHALARPIAGTHIVVDVDPELRVESVARAETLMRCAQEAITNALRHGRANQIRVHCRREGAGLALEVTNDGPAAQTIRFGNGLTGMRERLVNLGGDLTLAAVDTGGMRLRAWIPAHDT